MFRQEADLKVVALQLELSVHIVLSEALGDARGARASRVLGGGFAVYSATREALKHRRVERQWLESGQLIDMLGRKDGPICTVDGQGLLAIGKAPYSCVLAL